VNQPDLAQPTPEETRAYWRPRVRGGVTVIAGTLAYVAVGSAFGTEAGIGTALVGMLGSLAAMSVVWWLEAKRAAAYRARLVATQRGPGTT
jgi:NAD(P)H-hydrate repair Nnr-like enzyme with NAD(P)H-hydrate dehydratase domain